MVVSGYATETVKLLGSSGLLFPTGCSQHPRHVWGTNVRFIHSWYRVPFCELEGKDYVALYISPAQISLFSFSIPFPLCFGRLFVFARKIPMNSCCPYFYFTNIHIYTGIDLNGTQDHLYKTILKPV